MARIQSQPSAFARRTLLKDILLGLIFVGTAQADPNGYRFIFGNMSDDAKSELMRNATADLYNEQVGLELAYLATAAYCKNLDWIDTWDCGVACRYSPVVQTWRTVEEEDVGLFAVVGRRFDQTCFVAFRGTANVGGLQADLNSMVLVRKDNCWYEGEQCRVSGSFQNTYDAGKDRIKEALANLSCSQIDITGHSLGGALTTLAAWDMSREGYNLRHLYNFGSPRLGDVTFANAIGAQLAPRTLMRVTRFDDPIVLLPALGKLYIHAGTEVYYDGAVSDGVQICLGQEVDGCSVDKSIYFTINILKCVIPDLCGHFRYMYKVKQGLMMGNSCDDQRRLERPETSMFLP
mmetsp:Transcript_6491/g.14973  ORF Transcript_6491/g.14973 Transcript_6491/m.14973 type:complete len:348 (-) Transcript_6491:256-1299(-)|eukprot:CAMPEP_0206493600 /NCGR_PEP_ID=MMETSP0324_2-20121206/47116_1 /ASSEMBLY_ACC=CAM_ASM_000836 /TAXON_ID=2866 /ORGANISM="Crypthecodinium cohnii, Strain Seligo" /LENGTH=347 /DNA_ID=CAMNT_0053976869 /DNA_START=36 /DNA_END=1079 /DNA_ORIENTATION=+